ncbi:AI-2E family transporter [Rudaeicoccus suwonensis]|uniref:Putative PurR-regulated permease PerM n=1 Tax=Rudaeicoccus suwonensis TaxID=657409 RepID=A0A561E3F5_9MICO|nr:AI-2E family transporter [Rudaeicoccus suwonensis]TWE10146.1 putative PurR-regulated permease PerM [Rudaeicoccus suwonensis]
MARRPIDDVSFGVRVAALWSASFLLIFGAVWALIFLLNKVSMVTITMAVAIMVCALLEPGVRLLTKIKIPRSLAALIVFVLGIAVLGLLTWFVIVQITDARTSLYSQLQDAAVKIRNWLVDGPTHMSAKQADKYTTDLGQTIGEHRQTIVSGAVSTARSAVGILSGAVFCLFATIFLLMDNGSIWRWFVRAMPRHTHAHAYEAGQVAWRTLTAYMRSLVLLAAINSLAMVPVMALADLPLVMPLAVLLFLGSLVPLIGVTLAGVIVCLIALVTKGVVTAIVMGVALILIVQLFGNILNPIILGKAVDIHPLAILVTVTAGTLVAGIFGAFVAVPLVAVINNATHAVRAHHRDAVAERVT